MTNDLTKCPSCGGPADNGHDRCDPPNVYECKECEEYGNPYCHKCGTCGFVGCCGVDTFIDEHIVPLVGLIDKVVELQDAFVGVTMGAMSRSSDIDYDMLVEFLDSLMGKTDCPYGDMVLEDAIDYLRGMK